MNAETRNYYQKELDKIKFNGAHSAHVIFGSDGVATKALAVNHESARAIIGKLIEVFCTGEPIPPPLPQAPVEAESADSHRPALQFKTFMDQNGNKRVRVRNLDMLKGGVFTIQTNGNLLHTHNHGVDAITRREVLDYVRSYGTTRQKRIVGIL